MFNKWLQILWPQWGINCGEECWISITENNTENNTEYSQLYKEQYLLRPGQVWPWLRPWVAEGLVLQSAFLGMSTSLCDVWDWPDYSDYDPAKYRDDSSAFFISLNTVSQSLILLHFTTHYTLWWKANQSNLGNENAFCKHVTEKCFLYS